MTLVLPVSGSVSSCCNSAKQKHGKENSRNIKLKCCHTQPKIIIISTYILMPLSLLQRRMFETAITHKQTLACAIPTATPQKQNIYRWQHCN